MSNVWLITGAGSDIGTGTAKAARCKHLECCRQKLRLHLSLFLKSWKAQEIRDKVSNYERRC
jgi:hypothetical protein